MVENQPQSHPQPQPQPCFGNLCGGGSISINAIGQAGSAGQFEAWFGGGDDVTGEANAVEQGGSYSVIDIAYSTCAEADCTENGITANVGAYKIGETSAWAHSALPGQAAFAGNTAVSVTYAGFAAAVCSEACGTAPAE